MASKDLRAAGVNNYRLRQLRATQKELPSINRIIWETSAEEISQYELGGMSDEDILVQFRQQEQFDNINDYLRWRINTIRMERDTVEMTGHTLGFIQSLPDYEAALPNYTADEILNMTKQQRIQALQEAYHDRFGQYSSGGSDEVYLIQSLVY